MAPRNKPLALAIRQRKALSGKAIKAKRPPRSASTKGIEVDYLAQILPGLRAAKSLVDRYIIPALAGLLAQAGVRRDGYVDTLQDLMQLMRRRLEDEGPGEAQIQAMIRTFARRVDEFNSRDQARKIKAMLGIDVHAAVPELADKIAAFTRQNVELIRSIPEQFLRDVEQTVLRNVRAGNRASDIADELRTRHEVSESRAALIARDQVGKFNGELNQARQTALGIERYTWRTSQDERVRPDHQDREGNVYRWDDPPEDGHPGQPIQCRCTADPMVEDLLD